MNKEKIFDLVNQIDKVYKMAHNLQETKPEPKFKEGQKILWNGIGGITNTRAKEQRLATVDSWNKSNKTYTVDGWFAKESELRGVGDKVWWDGINNTGDYNATPGMFEIAKFCENGMLYMTDGVLWCPTSIEHISFTPARPAPKFAVGDKTDKGIITEIKWDCEANHWHYYVSQKDYCFDAYELSAKPKITVTLFKVKDGKVITETVGDSWLRISKDEAAQIAFAKGFCAILIDDGKTTMRRYCPEIEAIPDSVEKGWCSELGLAEPHFIEGMIWDAINHTHWTVESHGVKMRAYRMKDGSVDVVFPTHTANFINSPMLLKALGLEGHEMPQILSGKE